MIISYASGQSALPTWGPPRRDRRPPHPGMFISLPAERKVGARGAPLGLLARPVHRDHVYVHAKVQHRRSHPARVPLPHPATRPPRTAGVLDLIRDERYFVLHEPRRTGKTVGTVGAARPAQRRRGRRVPLRLHQRRARARSRPTSPGKRETRWTTPPRPKPRRRSTPRGVRTTRSALSWKSRRGPLGSLITKSRLMRPHGTCAPTEAWRSVDGSTPGVPDRCSRPAPYARAGRKACIVSTLAR